VSTSVGKPWIDIGKTIRTCCQGTQSTMRGFMRLFVGEVWKSTLITILGMIYVYFLVIASVSVYNLLRVHAIFLPPAERARPYERKSHWRKFTYRKMKSLNAAMERALDKCLIQIQGYLGGNQKRSRVRRQSKTAFALVRVKEYLNVTTKRTRVRRRSLRERVHVNNDISVKCAYNRRKARANTHYKNTSTHKAIAHTNYNKNMNTGHEKYAMTTISDQVGKEAEGHLPPRVAKVLLFETDSYEIKVDSGCSYSMSGVEDDFVPGNLNPVREGMSVGTYGGVKVPITGTGTIRWVTLDDTAR
jgi:hypothetical protein